MMEASERKKIGMVVLWSVAGTLLLGLVVLLIVPFTGAVDVAATHSHARGTHWFLETTQKRSVAARAKDVELPGDLGSTQRIQRGLVAYHEMCAGCHGAPGVDADWMGQGLNPDPTELWDESARKLGQGSPARDFWVIRNGIRMTGMPALAPTHADGEIWDLVAFLQHLPSMSPEAYASSVREAGLSMQTGHEHGAGGHGDEDDHHDAEEAMNEGEGHRHDDGGDDHHHDDDDGGG